MISYLLISVMFIVFVGTQAAMYVWGFRNGQNVSEELMEHLISESKRRLEMVEYIAETLSQKPPKESSDADSIS